MSCDDHSPAEPAGKRSRSLNVVAADVALPGPADQPMADKKWRSLEELAGDPALAKAAQHEFAPGASELDGVPRRDFIQLLGASLALTGAACTRPQQKIVPYVRRPVEVTPGNALHFATAYSLDGFG